MACKVKVNRHDFLAFRFYWNGREFWQGTGWKDTPKNRIKAEGKAVEITSVAMIEKHYGKYLQGDLDEQFSRLLGAKTETFTETLAEATGTDGDEVLENSSEEGRWAHLDLNQGPTGYEPVALTKLSYGPELKPFRV